MIVLPEEYEKCLEQYKNEKFEEHHLKDRFPNQILRDSTLELLDYFCTVIYYPLPDNENNQGFHISGLPFLNGDKEHFVFINTAQTGEKQVFTAAHELGHVWKVDDYACKHVNTDTPLSISEVDLREHIISRFAAMLLMPRDLFLTSTEEALRDMNLENGNIGLLDFLKLIVILMNKFFVPMKAVVLRMVETDIISKKSAEIILNEDAIPEHEICSIVEHIISDLGYVQFKKSYQKKHIEGLAELLDKAENLGCIAQSKIDNIRNAFELNKSTHIERNEVFILNTQK